VLSGQARYIIQKAGATDGSIERALCIDAAEGDVVVMPPDFGHVTVNPGPEPLVMANWVASNFDSVYGDYKLRGGACAYLLSTGELTTNPQYRDVPPVELVSGKDASKRFWATIKKLAPIGTEADQSRSPCRPASMYGLFVDRPELFEILHNPELLADFYA